MGAIQGAINQATGAIAGAAIGVKHVKEQELSTAQAAENQSIIANNEAATITKQANEAYDKAYEKDGLLEKLAVADTEAKVSQMKANKLNKDPNATPLQQYEARKNANEARRAFDSLQDQYDSLIDMMDRAAVMRKHAFEMSDIAVKKVHKFEKR